MRIAPETKVWGKASHVFCSEACAVSVLEVVKGYRCSWHHHEHRVNMFFVQSGVIDVISYMDDMQPSIRARLAAGDCYSVAPMMRHRFEVIESGVVVEVYYPMPVRLDDIVRHDEGGKL